VGAVRLSDLTLVILVFACVGCSRPYGPGERLTIQEDPSVSYEASVTPRGTDRLLLVLHLKTEQVERTLEPAVVPAVCPDLRR
jgi:hypothetical protein